MDNNMTKQEFYEFSELMAKDSKILFNQNAYHNSVYLGAFVLEAYIKILLIKNGSTKYFGHINSGNFLQRLENISPSEFNNSILRRGDLSYPTKLLSEEYDINYRYDVKRWSSKDFAENIQAEVIQIQTALAKLRIDGVLS